MANKSRENSFHANRVKILPNLTKCWLLKLFGLMLRLIEKFITHTSPNKNKSTKARQAAIECSQIRPSKAAIRKMFGSRRPPAPKLFFNFSGSFGAERRAFLK